MPQYPTINETELTLLKKIATNSGDIAAGGGGGGGSVSDWGDIGGTLSNQTDLQAALDAKADITTTDDLQNQIDALASAEPSPTGNQLVAGGGVTSDGGLDIVVAAALYIIQGTTYTSPQTDLTLAAADPTNPRIDVIAVNTSGAAVVITGTPAASPSKPDVDTITQLELTFFVVPAAGSAPTVSITDVYLENTEYTMTTSGGTVETASTNNPRSGTKDIEATSMAAAHYFQAQAPAPIDMADYDQMVFFIRSKASWAGAKQLTITVRSSGTQVGNSITFKSGTFGFDSSITSAYQAIVIPCNLFGADGQSVNQIRWTCAGGGGAIGFYVDDITLQGGVGSTSDSTRLRWRGDYSASLSYDANDVVLSGGVGYVALQAGVNNTPASSPTYWTPAFQGTDGDLTALSNLSGTNTIYYRSADNTWTAVTIGGNLTFSGGTLNAVGSGSGDMLLGTAQTVTAAKTFNAGTLKIASGGDLVDANGNELFKFTATASAVNEFAVTNSAASSDPTMGVTGGDTNRNFVIALRGTGDLRVDGTNPGFAFLRSGTSKFFIGVATTTDSLVTGSVQDDAVFRSTASKSILFTVDDGTSVCGKFNTSGVFQVNKGEIVINKDSSGTSQLQFQSTGTGKAFIGTPSNAGDLVTGSVAGDLVIRVQGKSVLFTVDSGGAVCASINTSGKLLTQATASGSAGFNVPHGTAPSSPSNGDFWSTSSGFFGRVNGGTVGPFIDSVAGTVASAFTRGSWSVDNLYYSVEYGGGQFMAINTSSTNSVLTSVDGRNWNVRASVNAFVAVNHGLAYGDGAWVGLSSTGVWVSFDGGTTWNHTTLSGVSTPFGICYGNGKFVIVTADNLVYWSTDAVNWTSATPSANNTWRAVCWGNGLYVAVASSGAGSKIMTSPDAITWTGRTAASSSEWRAICYGNGLFVCSGSSGTHRIQTSPDGITWTGYLPSSDNFPSIAYGNGVFIAMNETNSVGALRSTDGVTWTQLSAVAGSSTQQWNGVAYGNGMWVAVATSGTNRVSYSGVHNYNPIEPALHPRRISKTMRQWTPLDNQPPSSNYAVMDTRNTICLLSFNDSTDQSAVFVGIIPEGVDLISGIKVRIKWVGAGTSGNVVWTSAFERGNTDLDSDSFATAVSATTATDGTSGIPATTEINHSSSEIDGVGSGDLFRLKITRDADNGSDTMTGNASLVAVEIQYR